MPAAIGWSLPQQPLHQRLQQLQVVAHLSVRLFRFQRQQLPQPAQRGFALQPFGKEIDSYSSATIPLQFLRDGQYQSRGGDLSQTLQ